MATFVIIPTTEESVRRLGADIPPAFGNASYQLPRGEWLVRFEGTSEQLSAMLKIHGAPNETRNAVVLNFTGFYGHAPRTVWEWIAENQK